MSIATEIPEFVQAQARTDANMADAFEAWWKTHAAQAINDDSDAEKVELIRTIAHNAFCSGWRARKEEFK